MARLKTQLTMKLPKIKITSELEEEMGGWLLFIAFMSLIGWLFSEFISK